VAARRLTGILLVGGESRRFGSAKALASFDGETLAERAWRTLGTVCDERIAFGKGSDELELPFEIRDDGSVHRAPLAGVVAGLRTAAYDRCLVLPVDTPLVRSEHLRALADAGGDAAVYQTGPLPGAYARSALPALERCLREGRLALRDAVAAVDTRVLSLDRFSLANVNTPRDLALAVSRARALRAAQDAARAQGIEVTAPTILQDWNDTIVHLRPSPIVGRVRTSWIEDDANETALRELSLVRHAVARGAPVVPPTTSPPAGPHHSQGLVLTFWEYADELPGDASAVEAGEALRALHDAIADYRRALPPLWERLDLAQSIVDDAAACPALREEDRRFLAGRLRDLRSRLQEWGLVERPLHGGPHLANLLRTSAGLRWIDFDAVCRGPLEWDLAHLPDRAAASFPEARPDALAIARPLVGAEVAVWCWRTYGRAPEVDEAAHFHLGRLRGSS
jgi:molybdopterin-guanine dinucleotide biosynthesis protein A